MHLTRSKDKAQSHNPVKKKKKSYIRLICEQTVKTRYKSDYLPPSNLYVITKTLSYFMAKISYIAMIEIIGNEV